MTQQAPHATDRSAQLGRRSAFDFFRVTSLLRPTASSRDPDPQTPTIAPATAQEDRALPETDYRRSLRGLGDLQAAPPSHQPPAVEPILIPEDQRISQGTRVLITAPGEAPDQGDMTHFLNGLENAIPDLVLIHGHAPGAESITHDWARNRGIPQIVYAPPPESETSEMRAARLDTMIDVADPSRIRGRHAGTFERIPDLAVGPQHYAFRISLLFDPDAPRTFRAIERPRRAVADIANAIRNTAAPPPVYLQFHICEHRRGPDEIRSDLIRRDHFHDPAKADAYFDLVQARLQPGEFVVLRLSGKNLRISHAAAAAA